MAAHRQFRPWSSVEVAVQTPRPPAFDPTCYLWDTIGAQQENGATQPDAVIREDETMRRCSNARQGTSLSKTNERDSLPSGQPAVHADAPVTIQAMKFGFLAVAALCSSPVLALDGQPGLHDPRRPSSGRTASSTSMPPAPACRFSMSDDGWTWRRAGGLMQALPGGRPGPDVIARGGNNTWAPDVIRVGDKYFVYYAAPARSRRPPSACSSASTLDPGVAGLQMGGRRSGGLVRRRRGQQRDRSRRAARSDQRHAVAHLRLVLRLHPSRRTGSEDRQAPASRARSRSTSRSTPKRRS